MSEADGMPPASAPAGWGQSRRNPRLIMTVGLYSSASTWAYNVLRELMIAQHGEARVFAIYSDTVAKVISERQALGRYVVWKMHFGEPAWDVFAQLADPTILLTVRDPRDAVLSMVNRFNTSVTLAAKAVGASCNRVLQCAQWDHPILRYEDGFFRTTETIRIMAQYIGATLDDDAIDRIHDRFSTESVRAFAEQVPALPAERVKGDPTIDLYDEVTQIHRGHIGDGSVGKWRRQLTEEQQRAITAHFAPFLERFGYV
jgi:hypothetical protein